MINFNNTVALITGGSRGIGAATAILFAKAGADVAITFQKDSKSAKKVIQQIKKLGRGSLALQGNVAKLSDAKRIVTKTYRHFGRIDVLVNNAGIWIYGEIGKMSEKDWNETLDVNLKGTYYMCNLIVPIMKEQRGGKIINVASAAGQRGEPFHSHYAASKGGMIAFTKSLSGELAPWNIYVNCIAPGWVDTDMCAGVFRDPQHKEQIRKTIPRGKIATPDEIAGPIVFLASDLAINVVGAVLSVNGGSVLS